MRKNKFILIVFFLIWCTNVTSQIYVYFPSTGSGLLCSIKIFIEGEYLGKVKYNRWTTLNTDKKGKLLLTVKSGCAFSKREIYINKSNDSEHYIEAGLTATDMYIKEKNYANLSASIKAVLPVPQNQNKPEITVEKNLASSGTGFLINKKGVLATNYHVVENNKSIEVTLFNIKYSATILSSDKTNDISLIQLNNFNCLDSLPYNISTDFQIGDEVFTIGYPNPSIMGKNYKMTNGYINSLSGMEDDIAFMQISAPLQPGNSGGPLFNNKGDIIGITTSTINPFFVAKYTESIPQNVNYAVKSDYLKIIGKNYIGINKNRIEHLILSEKIKILSAYVGYIEVKR